MSESEEAFESADEDIDDTREGSKRQSRASAIKLSKIKETGSPERQPKTDGTAQDNAPELQKSVDAGATSGQIATKAAKEAGGGEPESVQGKDKELSVLEKLAQAATRDDKGSTNWGFGKWGSSILSTAATSVTTFTNQVSQGIGTVIETVENTLGAPTPEELAADAEKQDIKEPEQEVSSDDTTHGTDKNEQPEEKQEATGVSGILSGVTAFTKVIEATGSKVISGSLDTLEMIGKKTMDILTENDPGLRKKRAMFEGKANLSEVLREAKMKAEMEEQNRAKEEESNGVVHYSKLFDEHQGLVHLEALEMLCEERRTAVQQYLFSLGEEEKLEQNAVLDKIKRTCESLPCTDDTPDDEVDQDFDLLVTQHLTRIGLNLRGEKLKAMDADARTWLSDCTAEQERGVKKDPNDVYTKSLESMAEMTAKTMELYHKAAELLLVKTDTETTAVQYATHLTGLTAVLCTEIGILSSRFGRCLNTAADDSEDPDSVTPLITNIYLEASNSNTYIQDGFQLLVPVLQSLLLPK
uniref:Protein FAM114A2 n=1 Tax=Ornithodoros turicata TaxID=34597 RepID=A0A2R5LMP8_9ACAR